MFGIQNGWKNLLETMKSMVDDEFSIIVVVRSDHMNEIDAASVTTDINFEGFLVCFEMFNWNAIEVENFHGADMVHVDNYFIVGRIGKEDNVT